MKRKCKWILPLTSLTMVGASFAPIVSCNKSNKYVWEVKGNEIGYDYELISDKLDSDFQMSFTTKPGFAFSTEDSYVQIGGGQKLEFKLIDNILTINKNLINGKIVIYVAAYTAPTSYQLSYNGGHTEDITIDIGEQLTFDCNILPEGAKQNYIFKSENTGAADFTGNVLKGINGGVTVISAYTNDFPGLQGNTIKVTVNHAQSKKDINYENVDFNSKITVGDSISSYSYNGFDADFLFASTFVAGAHTVKARAEWLNSEKNLLPEIRVEITHITYQNNHTFFDIRVECPYDAWEIGKKYQYKLWFVVDEGIEGEEKIIEVEKDLFFENSNPVIKQIFEPQSTDVEPLVYGSEAIIEGFSSNFKIGSEYSCVLSIGEIIGINSDTSAQIENIKNTSSGSTFDVHFYFLAGLNLTNDMNFNFNYMLNGIKLQTSKNFIIRKGKSIQTESIYPYLYIDQSDQPSLVVDGFSANFEFDNADGSELPIVSAFCQPNSQTQQIPTTTITNIVKKDKITNFSIKIIFPNKFSHKLSHEVFYIYFKVDGEQLCSENKRFLLTSNDPISFIGNKETTIFHETEIEGESVDCYCVNVGCFACGYINSLEKKDLKVEFEWVSNPDLPEPDKISIYFADGDLIADDPFYVSLNWNSKFQFVGKPTYKITIKNSDDEEICIVDNLVLNEADENNFWNINFKSSDTNVTCSITTNTRENISVKFDNINMQNELWGVNFAKGGAQLSHTEGAAMSSNNTQLDIDMSKCDFIRGLDVNIESTYIQPSSAINITEKKDIVIEDPYYLNTFYTANEIDLKANETYYLKAELKNSGFPEPTEGFLLPVVYIGEPESFIEGSYQTEYDLVVYTNNIVTCYGPSQGLYAFFVDGKTPVEVVNKTVTIALTPRQDLGKHRLVIGIQTKK